MDRQAGAISVDPDRSSAEYHLYLKYLDGQVGAISVDSDQTQAEYHLYSKYLDRQVGSISVDLIGYRPSIIYIQSIWTGRQGQKA